MAARIPTPDDIDKTWLTGILREAGHEGVEVESYESKSIGTGQLGLCIRYSMKLRGTPGDAPASIIGKFPSTDESSRTTGVMLRNYLKEVRFYQHLRDRLSIRTPCCYFADIEGEGPEFALFLEDMAPAEQGDQLAGCSDRVARSAIHELVGLHAPTWGAAELDDYDWLEKPSQEASDLVKGLYGANIDGFSERYGNALAADELAIIQAVATTPKTPFSVRDETAPLAAVHVDYRLDNLLIDESNDPPTVAAVDWQSITLGNPLADVAYFIGAGMQPEERRAIEETLVREYYDRLGASITNSYDWDTCWLDYRRGTFAGFGVTVIASMMVVQTDRGDEMFTAMARRHARHALDHNALDLLS